MMSSRRWPGRAGVAFVVAVLGGALTACAAPENHGVADGTPAAVAQPAPASTKPSPKAEAEAKVKVKAKATTKVVTEVRLIPFKQRTVEDASLAKGHTGNGPEYVAGPVTVIGSDVYDLDRDNDGVACED